MSDLRIGLVVEGPTDLIVLSQLLDAYCKKNNPDITPVFVNLQPRCDRTSGSRNGGWELVYKWCLNNSPDVRSGQFFGGGLFDEGMSGLTCDIIVVQLDADICCSIGDKSGVMPVPEEDACAQERGSYIYSTINEWLWPNESIPDNRHYPAPAVESTEAWLVAALSNDLEPEENKNILRRLLEVEAESRGVVAPVDGKKLQKNDKKYIKLASKAHMEVDRVVDKCPHFKNLANELFS